MHGLGAFLLDFNINGQSFLQKVFSEVLKNYGGVLAKEGELVILEFQVVQLYNILDFQAEIHLVVGEEGAVRHAPGERQLLEVGLKEKLFYRFVVVHGQGEVRDVILWGSN